jgi:DNA-binding NtrC family response regulator
MESQRNVHSAKSSATILVVDDESSILKLCNTLLDEAGFTVLEADGSSDAIKICIQHKGPIRLLLADLVLPPPGLRLFSAADEFPYVNGHQLAVRATMIRPDLRILLMSGNPDKELEAHEIKRGSLPFLAKPFEKDEFIGLVRQVLAQPAPSFASSGQDQSGHNTDWFG